MGRLLPGDCQVTPQLPAASSQLPLFHVMQHPASSKKHGEGSRQTWRACLLHPLLHIANLFVAFTTASNGANQPAPGLPQISLHCNLPQRKHRAGRSHCRISPRTRGRRPSRSLRIRPAHRRRRSPAHWRTTPWRMRSARRPRGTRRRTTPGRRDAPRPTGRTWSTSSCGLVSWLFLSRAMRRGRGGWSYPQWSWCCSVTSNILRFFPAFFWACLNSRASRA